MSELGNAIKAHIIKQSTPSPEKAAHLQQRDNERAAAQDAIANEQRLIAARQAAALAQGNGLNNAVAAWLNTQATKPTTNQEN